jgi:plasmid stabilization system protein ParE
MKVRFTSRAFADLNLMHSYLFERNPKAAGEVVGFVEKVIEGLKHFPEIGQRSDEADVRVILAGRYPYRIYYQTDRDEVLILHIRHTARKAPKPGDM